ncbi:hypothetical protein D3C83_31880 [compost metagenome]
MNDTSLEFARLVAARYAGMRPDERVRIATGMFDTARELVIASFPPDLSPMELRHRLCRRFYGELADRAFPQEGRRVTSDERRGTRSQAQGQGTALFFP